MKSFLEEQGLSPEEADEIYAEMDDESGLHHQWELEQQEQLDKPLGTAAIQCNVEYYRAQRIKAHSEYLRAKRQERYWQQQLNTKQRVTPL